MKKTLSLRDFTILMIASLANNSKSSVTNPNKKIAVIPVDYKQRIENILCAENNWKDIFSEVIDTDLYFQDHFAWEQELAVQIEHVLQTMGKEFEYDFVHDSINIPFSQKEIDFILSNYKNNHIKMMMKQFTALIGDYIYTREFQEEFHDYNSSSVQYMKKRTKEQK